MLGLKTNIAGPKIPNTAGIFRNPFAGAMNEIIFNHMVDYLYLLPMIPKMTEQEIDTQQLSKVLKAVSDPTRRSILTKLVQEGHIRVTDIAAYFDMSLNSVSKHIKVLEAAGLVNRQTAGRIHFISANMGPVSLIDDWFRNLRSIWDIRLERLDNILEEDSSDE